MDEKGSGAPEDPKGELLSRLNVLLGQLLASPRKQSAPAGIRRLWVTCITFFQSKFFVAILSGFLLWLLPYLWQERAARFRVGEEKQRQAVEIRQRLAYQFAREFPLSLHLANNFRRRQLWMTDPSNCVSNAQYVDGRFLRETGERVEELVERYFALGPPASTINQILAAFAGSDEIRGLAFSINESVNCLLLATNESDVGTAFNRANTEYQVLTGAIFAELSRENESTHP